MPAKTCCSRALVAALLVAGAVSARPAAAVNAQIDATRLVYADLARQIGGERVRVLTVPARMGALQARRSAPVAGAPLALTDVGEPGKTAGAIEAARFAQPVSVADHYYWYDVATMRALARALAARLQSRDAGGASAYAANLARYEAGLDRIDATIKEVAHYYRGSDVFVADSLPQRVIKALGFRILDPDVMRGRISHADIDAVKEAIAERDAAILCYDADSKSKQTADLLALAKESGVPAVAFREDLPAALTYQTWILREVNAIRGALNEAAP